VAGRNVGRSAEDEQVVERFSITLCVDEREALGELLLRGEFDYSATQNVIDTAASALTEDSVRRLVVDLTDVTFIDSSGVGALVNIYRMSRATGAMAVLRDPTPATAAILRITSVDQLFVDEASWNS
jgi:anti-anti-sigma factor